MKKNIFSRFNQGVLLALIIFMSIVFIAVDVISYQQYSKQLIASEQTQLLTEARTIGESIEKYVDQELRAVNLYFDTLDTQDSEEEIQQKAENFLLKNDGLYIGAALLDMEGNTIYSSENYETPDSSISVQDGMDPSEATIIGKMIGSSGWYHMYVLKTLDNCGLSYQVMLMMDLNRIYQDIVMPVKLGEGGYSVVKDKDLAIIMHNAQDQIGMDAVYDRAERYPDLDFDSLFEWLDMQRNQDEGVSVIDTYIWGSENPPAIRRIVAYTTIHMQNESWIVNSTLPIEELAVPLRRMLWSMTGITIVYFTIISIILIYFSRMRLAARNQQKEIRYLREINEGMEMVAKQNDEIRHYQRVQSLGLMASHIVHEFNNYLTPIMVYAELLAGDETLSEENRMMMAEIMNSTNRAGELSKELLAFAHQDSGKSLEVLDITSETTDAVRVVEQLTPAKIKFQADIISIEMPVLLRHGMIQQILMNLCKNAYNAMEKTDRKQLTIRLTKGTAFLYQTNPDPVDAAVLEVEDTGCGISEESLQQIFEPFFTTKGSKQGTGLGLAVIQNLMNAVHGTIHVTSQEKIGTKFTLIFPIADTAGDKDERKKLPKIRKIAFVSTDEAVQERIKKALMSIGNKYEITLYSHPAQILQALEKDLHSFELVLSSYTLPGLTGIELLEMIKRKNPEVRVVLFTENAESNYDWYVNNQLIDRVMTVTEAFAELKLLNETDDESEI